MAHTGSNLWHEIQHRLQHHEGTPDAVETLILEGIAILMTVQDDINNYAAAVETAATSVGSIASGIGTAVTAVLAEIQGLQAQIANGQAVDLTALAKGVGDLQSANTSLQTAANQLGNLQAPQAPAEPATPATGDTTTPATGDTSAAAPADGSASAGSTTPSA